MKKARLFIDRNYVLAVLVVISVVCAFAYIYRTDSHLRHDELKKENEQIREEIISLECDKRQIHNSIDTASSIESISRILSELDTNKSR